MERLMSIVFPITSRDMFFFLLGSVLALLITLFLSRSEKGEANRHVLTIFISFLFVFIVMIFYVWK